MSDWEEWLEERDAVVKRYDLQELKEFFAKWQAKGIYEKRFTLPSDEVIEISMRKMVYHMTSATDQQKREAAEWLNAHGCSTKL